MFKLKTKVLQLEVDLRPILHFIATLVMLLS
jgi:hypothetical protein